MLVVLYSLVVFEDAACAQLRGDLQPWRAQLGVRGWAGSCSLHSGQESSKKPGKGSLQTGRLGRQPSHLWCVFFFWCCFNLSSLAGEPSKGKFPARGTEHTSEGYWEFWVAIREARNKFLINISMAQIEGKKIKLEITSWFPHLNSDLWFLCQDYPWHQSNCEWDNVITDDRDNHWLIFHDLIEIRCCHGLFHDSNGCKVALPTSGSALAAVIELLQNRTSCSLILASSHQAKGAVKSCKSRNTSRWVTEFLPLDLSGAKFELSHPHKHSSVRKMNSLKFCKAASSFPRSNPTNHQPVQDFAKVGIAGGVW